MLRLARDVLLVGFGTYGQFLVTLVTLPLTARLLGTEGVGLVAVGMSAYFLGSVLVDLGATQYFAARVDDPDITQVRGAYAVVRSGLFAVLVVAALLGWALGVEGAARMILLGAVAGGIWSLSEDWLLIGRGRFGASTAYQAAGRVAYLVALVVLLPQFPTPEVALACLGGSSIVTVIVTGVDADRHFGRLVPSWRVGEILRTAAPVLASRLLLTGYGQGGAAAYSTVLDAVSLGLFSAADRLVRAGQSVLDPIGFALLPRMTRIRDGQAFRARTMQGAAGCLALAVVAAAGLTLVAPLVIRIVYGTEFAEATDLLRILAWILPATTLTSYVTTAVLPAQGRTSTVLSGAVLGVTLAASALLITSVTGSVVTMVVGVLVSEWAVALWFVATTARTVLRRESDHPDDTISSHDDRREATR
ncbi:MULTISPECIES: lipopolysaccharide biosynthesis protein [Nocardiaceae]|uniref:O-antigen/teichoic acid export membrane protein n=1 Tax=Rhodococcoides corynebacterioides TaxID=53972 RepID=A0ABS2KWK7_9NOCA|nr:MULTISPECIES: oligosaccharide flippase family protein [Rhodococcus]MBM7416312.1 O-antigen/teichoic acid export membrane protein [Rhodococcus corynebacterioides]MBP1114565.1 O-antigen/teichoic acid export membrane protein [Rhodococcus sp. PvP016]